MKMLNTFTLCIPDVTRHGWHRYRSVARPHGDGYKTRVDTPLLSGSYPADDWYFI